LRDESDEEKISFHIIFYNFFSYFTNKDMRKWYVKISSYCNNYFICEVTDINSYFTSEIIITI